MFNLEKKWTPQEIILATTILLITAIYAYFFILLPQYWTLRDDYGFALKWGANKDRVVEYGISYFLGIMENGRFQPMDALNRVWHYALLPTDARVFRITYFLGAGIALTAFVGILRSFQCSRDQILLALLLVLANLSLKEWLTTLTVSEGIGATFFLLALWVFCANAKNGRWWAVFLFPLSFSGKESFVVLAPAFFLVAYLRRRRDLRNDLLIALLILAEAALFVIFIKSLPQRYTEGFSVNNISIIGLLKSFLLPPLRSFGPAVFLLFLPFVHKRFYSGHQRALVFVGLSIVAIFTVFINAWGPFDSWFYLHTIIPFGWCMVFAATVRAKFFETRVGLALLLLTVVYQTISVTNGSKNYYDYFRYSRETADFACFLSKQDPTQKFVTNCHEASMQLVRYLELEKKCDKSFHIDYVRTDSKEFSYLVSGKLDRTPVVLYSRHCDNWMHLSSASKDRNNISFGPWIVVPSR